MRKKIWRIRSFCVKCRTLNWLKRDSTFNSSAIIKNNATFPLQILQKKILRRAVAQSITSYVFSTSCGLDLLIFAFFLFFKTSCSISSKVPSDPSTFSFRRAFFTFSKCFFLLTTDRGLVGKNCDDVGELSVGERGLVIRVLLRNSFPRKSMSFWPGETQRWS